MQFIIPSHLCNISLMLLALAAVASCSYCDNDYIVVIDAGSSGTRAHVFNFIDSEQTFLKKKLVGFYQHKVKFPLAKCESNYTICHNNITELLDFCEDFVPQEERDRTPVLLGATAGLRMLPNVTRQRILDFTAAILRNSSFLATSNSARMLSGIEEGSFAWISVNYATGKLENSTSDAGNVTALPLVAAGGASTQFAIPEAEDDESPNSSSSLTEALPQLHVSSSLGVGGSASLLKLSNYTEGATHVASNCVANDLNQNFTLGNVQFLLFGNATFNDSKRYPLCRTLARSLVNELGLNPIPESRSSKEFYGTAGLYYVAKFMKKNYFSNSPAVKVDKVAYKGFGKGKRVTIRMRDFKLGARKICQDPEPVGIYSPYYCILATVLIEAFDTIGFGRDDVTMYGVNHDLIGWPLGAAFNHLLH